MGIPLFDSTRIGEMSWEYFYYPHVTEADYHRIFNEACEWYLENDDNSVITIARIYYVKEASLRKSVLRKRNKKRNSQGLHNIYSSNNKILNEVQEEAIRQYCYEQWEAGLGAIYQMVQAAIAHLKAVSTPSKSNYLANINRLNLLQNHRLQLAGSVYGYGTTRHFIRLKRSQLHMRDSNLIQKRMLEYGFRNITISWKSFILQRGRTF
jgi:hypothetical protein